MEWLKTFAEANPYIVGFVASIFVLNGKWMFDALVWFLRWKSGKNGSSTIYGLQEKSDKKIDILLEKQAYIKQELIAGEQEFKEIKTSIRNLCGPCVECEICGAFKRQNIRREDCNCDG